jgi:hypothetical protein
VIIGENDEPVVINVILASGAGGNIFMFGLELELSLSEYKLVHPRVEATRTIMIDNIKNLITEILLKNTITDLQKLIVLNFSKTILYF